ncbi:hypothetical protein [Polaribacter sp. R77954]|uniref:hypothetical protein n=1 Tax=Polaribacter sp. R77954 TaxID=3093870 RepID=UPI0037C502AD
MELILYRGIQVEKEKFEEIRKSIITDGLIFNNNFTDKIYDIKYKHKSLKTQEIISRKNDIETSNQIPVLCFGDETCAKIYALRNLKDKKTLIIKAKINIENVVIDSRDFLFKILSNFKNLKNEKKITIIENMKKVFGAEVEEYFTKINSQTELDKIFAIGDLICNDKTIMLNYYCNKLTLKGGYKTKTKHSFFVTSSIAKDKIQEVYTVKENFEPPNTDIDFKTLL